MVQCSPSRQKHSLRYPTLRATGILVAYHLGSMILGSLLTSLLRLLRTALAFVNRFAARDRCSHTCTVCCSCCLTIFEKCLKYINRNAYILICEFSASPENREPCFHNTEIISIRLSQVEYSPPFSNPRLSVLRGCPRGLRSIKLKHTSPFGYQFGWRFHFVPRQSCSSYGCCPLRSPAAEGKSYRSNHAYNPMNVSVLTHIQQHLSY